MSVSFIEGDIDRPIVTGVTYNGSHSVPVFSGAGALPANKTLSGIKTKEHEGGQYGELLFDDSKGEVRTKLSSEHGKTQLNLGYLIHPRTDGKGEARGEGFELRSDKQGAIRASGLLISTEAKGGASGKQLDHSPAQSQLESALALAQSLGETATNQLADSIETGDEGKTVEADNSAGSTAIFITTYTPAKALKRAATPIKTARANLKTNPASKKLSCCTARTAWPSPARKAKPSAQAQTLIWLPKETPTKPLAAAGFTT